MKKILLCAIVLSLAGCVRRQPAAPVAGQSAPALPVVTFATQLSLKGTILNAQYSCKSDVKNNEIIDHYLEWRSTSYDKNVRPFPQHQIVEIPGCGARIRNYRDELATSGSSTVTTGYQNLDIRQLKVPKGAQYIRVKVVVAYGVDNPVDWKKVESTTFYSKWLEIPSGKKQPL